MKKLNLPIINNNSNKTYRGNSVRNSSSPKRYNNNMRRIKSGSNINLTNNEATKSFVEDMKKGSYNILVCVRCRPLSISEYQLSSYETIRIMDNKMVILMDPIEYNGPSTVFKNRNREQTYAFDFAFDKNSSQNLVFENSTKFLIEGVVNGYNATVFAYGATGAGKTYTMLGNDGNPGIMPLTLRELFNKVNSFGDRDYKLKFWYLEIYNENIRDLLKFIGKNNNNNNLENEYLDLREDPERGIVVSGITEVNVTNSNDMLKILKRGNRNRTQEATGANETSSRSHAILQVSIEYKDKNSGINIEIKYSKLSLIDLAGSERASATQNRGIRLIEGANINRSLLTLGNCINALCDANMKGNKKIHIPYRDSKLTRLLKDSLGGNARTVMIANVSPAINTFEDTYNTLKYANRAKNIKTFVTRNVLTAQYHISNYINIINNLKEEISQLKKQIINKEEGKTNIVNSNFNTDNFRNNNFNNNRYRNKNNNNSNTYYFSDIQPQIERTISPGNYNNSNCNNDNTMISDDEFKTIVKEMKKACDGQVLIKQKIISIQNEINKLKETSSNIYNNLQQTLNINQNKYKQFSSIIEKIYNENNSKNNCSEIQKEFLSLIMKNSSYKIQMLDNKYNNLMNLSKNDIQDEYIIELENQIKYRDEILSENEIDLSLNPNIKTLETLRNEYSAKNSKNSNVGFKRVLPPVSSHSSFNNDLSFVLNNTNNIITTNNNINNKGGMLFSSKKNTHLENMKNKFNLNNNNKNTLMDYKTKNNYSSYKILPDDYKKTKKNSNSSAKDTSNSNINKIYNLYKYNSNLKKNNSPKKNKSDTSGVFNYSGINNKNNNNSFCLDNLNINNNNQSRNSTFDSGNMYLKDQIPQIKRTDLNIAINQRNISRKKFLDNINSPKKIMF